MKLPLLLAAALLLSACAGLQRPKSEPINPSDLRLSGRISVQVAGDSGKAAGGNAGFELSGNPAAGQLELSTPLGSLLARASWSDGEVLLQTQEDQRRFADLDALTRELLGEAIPVAALFDWLQGRPWPQAASRSIAGNGFEQLGWQIDLARSAERLIVATRIAAPVVTLRARIEP